MTQDQTIPLIGTSEFTFSCVRNGGAPTIPVINFYTRSLDGRRPPAARATTGQSRVSHGAARAGSAHVVGSKVT